MELSELLEELEEAEALLIEPREYLDAAIIGIGSVANGQRVAVYDSERCIEAFMLANGWDREDAEEWFSFNTLGAYVGPATPLFVDLVER